MVENTHTYAVNLIRKRLWSHGYGVKLRVGEGYDLLVDSKVKVSVVVVTQDEAGKVPYPKGANINALVLLGPFDALQQIAFVNSKRHISNSPKNIIGKSRDIKTHVEKSKRGAGGKRGKVA